jgi:hypothetical protein
VSCDLVLPICGIVFVLILEGLLSYYLCAGRVTVDFKNVDDHFIWAFAVSMDLILIGIEYFYGMSWLVCLVGGTCCGALGEILMSLIFLVRDQVISIFV